MFCLTSHETEFGETTNVLYAFESYLSQVFQAKVIHYLDF